MDLSSRRNFPVFGVLAGLVFIIAGLFAQFHLELGLSLALILVFAGVAVVLVALFRFRIRMWDLVLFIIGLILLANVSGINYYQNSKYSTSSYTVGSEYVHVPTIDLFASSALGSIDVRFSTNSSLAYQVVFQNSFFGFPFFYLGNNSSLTNQTRNGILYLNASAQGSITITIGADYVVSINANSGVGSISVISPPSSESNIQSVSLETGAGSVDAQINGANISSISLKTGTGSVDFVSNYLRAGGSNIPISINSGTGSININVKIASDAAVRVDATSSLGSISQHLTGFTINTDSSNHLVASIGNIETAPRSFLISASVGTGSMNINGELVSP